MNLEKEALLETNAQALPVSLCAHHWVIETPAGPVSRGQCKRCGESESFSTPPTALSTGRMTTPASRAGAGHIAVPSALASPALDE